MEHADIYLTCVIPAFNEAVRLPESLASLRAWIDTQSWDYEIIVVDDGSTDETGSLVKRLAYEWPELKLIEGPHTGKGGAVKAGVLAARGQIIAMADADFSMPAKEFARFLVPPASQADVALGSREAPGAKRYGEPIYRHLMGRVFNRLVQILVLPGIEDSQCGFKVLNREVAVDLCQRQTLTGLGFDVELLAIARQRAYTLLEVPIPWYYVSGSKVNPVRDTVTMIADVLHVRRNVRLGRYATASDDRVTHAQSVSIPSE